VLVTRFLSPDGVGEIEDFMPVGIGGAPERYDQVVRRVRVARGRVELEVRCEPAFDYGRTAPRVVLTQISTRDRFQPSFRQRNSTRC
jgi:hypothetical protein